MRSRCGSGRPRLHPFHCWNTVYVLRRFSYIATPTLSMASKYESKKEICDSSRPSAAQADVVAIRLEVDDLCPLPPSVRELAFNSSPETQEPREAAPETPTASGLDGGDFSKGAMGQRVLHDITIETYTPQDNEKIAELSLTAEHSDPGAVGGIKGDVSPTLGSAYSKKEQLPFFSGIPSVEVVKGLLHLYKPTSHAQSGDEGRGYSEKICVLSIPAHQVLSDMLEFFGPVLPTMSRLCVIRDSSPNQYMLLITLKDKVVADQFYTSYNGRPYNSMEKTTCQLVFVRKVELRKSSQGGSLPSAGLTELPSCPVCLEKLDDSVLTILCNHSFHTHCLTQWEDSTCPVCRYTQTPEPSGENKCFICNSPENLWICLICGHIGCGRYEGGHANIHFKQTQHTYAMRLGTQRVWDYIGDNYVHRIVQNKSDGKLVEVARQEGMVGDDEKIDSLQLEYTYLLTTQLESQRLFFEEKLARVEKDLNEQLSAVELRCRTAVGEKEAMEEKVKELEREKKAGEKKLAQLQTKMAKATADLKEEREMNKCLSDNQKLWKDRVGQLEKKIDETIRQKEVEMKDLQDQVRDLMFYLETQKKIAESPEDKRQDIQGGQLVVTHTAAGTSSTPSRKSRKKK